MTLRLSCEHDYFDSHPRPDGRVCKGGFDPTTEELVAELQRRVVDTIQLHLKVLRSPITVVEDDS